MFWENDRDQILTAGLKSLIKSSFMQEVLSNGPSSASTRNISFQPGSKFLETFSSWQQALLLSGMADGDLTDDLLYDVLIELAE